MSSLLVGLAVIIIAPPAILWAAFNYARQLEEEELQRASEWNPRAKARGWTYSGQRQGDIAFQVFGTMPDGLAWRVEYDCQHGSSAPKPVLYFKMPALKAGRLEWRVLGAASHCFRSSAAVRPAICAGLRLRAALGTDDGDELGFLHQARTMRGCSDLFRQTRVLLARGDEWGSLLDARLEWLLAGWDSLPPLRDFHAELSVEGLVIRLGCEDPGFEMIERVVRLGEELASRSRVIMAAMVTGPEIRRQLV